MDKDRPLRDRGETLEEEFFRKQNQELIARMRATEERTQAREHLRAATGIQEETVLDRLLDGGVTSATVAALAIAPLVAVAWADRKVDARERRAVMEEAENAGIEQKTPEHELLENWLDERPPESLLSTWADYAGALTARLDEEQRREFHDTTVQRCRAIANATGGFAGIGRLSPEEQRVIDQVEAALKR